ncbi:TlpA family protein disulfide reductase [Mucilaginibacter sp.]
MKAKYLFIIILMIFTTRSKADGIKIGQKVPNILIEQIIHFQHRSAKLSDFRGKFLLLDFWFTSCGSCIEEMPKLQALQQKFPDKFKVLMVTYQNKEKVEKFFRESKTVNGITLTSVVADSILNLLFPHVTDPHEVWIDDKGIVQAITETQSVTEENLLKFINHQALDLPLKVDAPDKAALRTYKPVILYNYDKYKSGMLYYSYLGEGRDDVAGLQGTDELDSSHKRIRSTNCSMVDLYKLAYGKIEGFPNSRVFCLFGDTAKYHPFNIEHDKNYLFCYDIVLKDTSKTRIYSCMLDDLNRYFGIKSSLVKRPISCLVIKKVSLDDKLKSKGGKADDIRIGNKYQFYNMTFTTIIQNYVDLLPMSPSLQKPILDETGYTGTVDVNFDLSDFAALKKSLALYGLDLVEGERQIDIIVLKDK